MSGNARDALRLLVGAFEEHLEAVATRRGPDDAAVDDAYESLAEAFERYEEALDVEFAESLPLVVDDSEDFDDEPVEPDDVDDDIDDDEEDDADDDLDPHAAEDEDEMDDDIEEFDLR